MEKVLQLEKLSEFIGNKNIVEEFNNWLKHIKNDIHYKKSMFFNRKYWNW